MCGIVGFVRIAGNENKPLFLQWMREIAKNSLVRGPDCMGAVYFNIVPAWQASPTRVGLQTRHKGKPLLEGERALEQLLPLDLQKEGVSINFRGIPTTEQSGHEILQDDEIQPFLKHDFSVAHNGLLSNDRARCAELPRLTSAGEHDIDSYAFVQMAYHLGMANALSQLEGSWALALISHAQNTILLSRTFLGLHLAVLTTFGSTYLVWSSEAFPAIPVLPTTGYFVWEMIPYSKIQISLPHLVRLLQNISPDARAALAAHSITNMHMSLQQEALPTKAVVIMSGGLDSTTVAQIACMRQYKEVHLLHFQYGARAEQPEEKAVRSIAEWLQNHHKGVCKIILQLIPLTFLMRLGGSTLTEHSLTIAEGEEGVETAHEWVPARNIVMSAMAAAYCDRHDIQVIMLGTNREESAVYSDNSSEFHAALSRTLALCTNARPRIIAPLENAMKAHIYQIARDIKAPIHLSWSCYHDGERTRGLHCGKCGPCQLRKTAAAMNGTRDNIDYASALNSA